ncbi:subtilisin-like protease SBT2.5 [Selaginella moellendorffii]|uniref:subtilisin-like protease SBT2.5 n=1 Tax=Selaginella moellendorffii TaxID=88036 RepID=UPI000D1C2A74|nr:subtilisin-like protease SBT2.5 [Selaginella moellendorffii]|eukprot:XP_024524776.1 subtilisin-like protease SBT2.5 [Selaginella moellendorffii]
MAAPHIAGVAALIKQKHPSWTPAMISSSIMTTASVVDSKGGIIQAVTDHLVIGTPFDFGAGFVNVSAALDPGIVFDAVKQATHSDCSIAMDAAYNLNSPSITVSSLKGNVVVQRRVSSVSDVAETYTAALVRPENVTADIVPATFTLGPHQEASFELRLGLTDGKLLADYVFGQLMLVGDRGHSARVFITVASK